LNCDIYTPKERIHEFVNRLLVEVALQSLNVLIGANGSGKSNFLEIFRLLHAIPGDIAKPVIDSGGVKEWMWKGDTKLVNPLVYVTFKRGTGTYDGHRLFLDRAAHRLQIAREDLEINIDTQVLVRLFENDGAGAKIATRARTNGNPLRQYGAFESIASKDFDPTRSALSQFRDAVSHPDLHEIARMYESIGLYTDVGFGHSTPARRPQLADMDTARLFEDGSNLALVLNDLQNRPKVWNGIITRLREFHPRIRNVITV
jgi:predicted ATPase